MESLTKFRIAKLSKPRDEFRFRNVWISYNKEGPESSKTYYS